MNGAILALLLGQVGLVGQVGGQAGRHVPTRLTSPTWLTSPGGAQIPAERNQREALRHYRLGEDALHTERLDVAEKEFRVIVDEKNVSDHGQPISCRSAPQLFRR